MYCSPPRNTEIPSFLRSSSKLRPLPPRSLLEWRLAALSSPSMPPDDAFAVPRDPRAVRIELTRTWLHFVVDVFLVGFAGRPHQSLNYQTPAEYARHWMTETQPAPS